MHEQVGRDPERLLGAAHRAHHQLRTVARDPARQGLEHQVAQRGEPLRERVPDPPAAHLERAHAQHRFRRRVQVGHRAPGVHREHPGREVAQDHVVVHPHAVQLAGGARQVVVRAPHAAPQQPGQHTDDDQEPGHHAGPRQHVADERRHTRREREQVGGARSRRGEQPARQAIEQPAGDDHEHVEQHELALAPAGAGGERGHQREVGHQVRVHLQPHAAPQRQAAPEHRRHRREQGQRPHQHAPRGRPGVRAQHHARRDRDHRDQQPRAHQGRETPPARVRRVVRRALRPFRAAHAVRSRHQLFPPATTLMSLNMGRYIAMTMPPTMPPITTIMTGSMIEVSASTALSTSAS